MTVRLEKDTVHLEGACPVEEAEDLLSLIDGRPDRVVDLTGCERLHAALLQALITHAPVVRGTPQDPFLHQWVVPSLVALPRDLALFPKRLAENVD